MRPTRPESRNAGTRREGGYMNKTASRSAGKLAPNKTVPQVSAQCRVGDRQRQQNVASFLERMQAAAAKHRKQTP